MLQFVGSQTWRRQSCHTGEKTLSLHLCQLIGNSDWSGFPNLITNVFFQVSEGSSSTCLYMDSGCSKRVTENNKNFLSLKALHRGGVFFGNGKKVYSWHKKIWQISWRFHWKCVIFCPQKGWFLTSKKNMHASKLEITRGDNLTCLIAQSESADFRQMRLGHVSSSLLNKLVSRDRSVVWKRRNIVRVKCLMHVSKGNKQDLYINQRSRSVLQGFLS